MKMQINLFPIKFYLPIIFFNYWEIDLLETMLSIIDVYSLVIQ